MFFPDNIDFIQSKTYILSIRLMPSGFYFSIHSPTDSTVFFQNNVLFSKNISYLKNIEKLIFDFSFFSNNFREINVIYVNDKLTLVPAEFYNKKLIDELLAFNHHSFENKVMSNNIDKLGCRLIWGMNAELYSFLNRTLLNPRFSNHLAVLMPFFNKLHDKTTTALYINFNDDEMIDAIAFSNEKLILAKTFQAKNSLEACYYIQKTWEVLNLDAHSDKIFFSGKTEKNKTCIDTIKKLIPQSKKLFVELVSELKIDQSETPTEILYQLCEL